MSGISSRATNGTVTKSVASTMPGTAKMIRTPCAMSHSPNKPCAPNKRTKTRPDTTGETENGRSIKVTSAPLPRKRNFDTHQAAESPKAALIGTTIAATINVSAIAARASGSAERAQVTAETFARGFDSDHDQRSKHKQAKEPDGEGDQARAGKGRLRGDAQSQQRMADASDMIQDSAESNPARR